MYVLVEDTPGVGSIGYDDELKAVVLTWLKNDNNAFRPRLEAELTLVVDRGLLTVVIDTSQVKGALNEGNQQWLVDDFFPRLAKTQLKALVSVVPQSALSALVNQRSFGSVQGSFEVCSVGTVAEAYAAASRVANGLPAKG